MKHNSDSGKESDSWKVFRAFLGTLSYSELSREDSWTYLSGNNEPDFVSSDGKIAVEPTGWIDEEAIGEAKTLESFNRKIRDVIHAKRNEFKALEGHWVRLEACRVPRGIDWEDFARRILAFLVGRVPGTAKILRLENPVLPEEMKEWFRAVTFYKNPGLSVRADLGQGYPFNAAELPDIDQLEEESLKESLQSFKQNVTKKIQKADKYRVGGVRSFTELWLVIHYDDTALEWATPLVPVEFSYGREAQETQRKLAERVRDECLNDLRGGRFHKVYLLFADATPPFAERLWPPPAK